MKKFGVILVLLLACAGVALFVTFGPTSLIKFRLPPASLRTCSSGELEHLQEARGDELAPHRRFTLPVLHYASKSHRGEDWQFRLSLQVDAKGVPVCYQLGYNAKIDGNAPRQAIIDNMSSWRYTPFMRNGVAVPALVDETIEEDQPPSRTVAMPEGPLNSFGVGLTRSACFGNCPNYKVTLSGDGTAVFEGKSGVVVPGKHSYKVSPEDLAALRDAAKSLNVWSMDNHYFAEVTDMPAYDFTVTVAEKSKSISDYAGRSAGMPVAVETFMNLIDEKSHANAWISLSPETINFLSDENFDFRSQAGADLLARAMSEWGSPHDEDALLMLIEKGAPLRGGHRLDRSGRQGEVVVLLDSALSSRRLRVADELIARGALKSGGRLDQALIDRAFQSAIGSGDLDALQKVWSYHPGLTFLSSSYPPLDDAHRSKTAPVTLLLDGWHENEPDWQGFAIARFLLEQGCDINSSDASGRTLLHVAAQAGDPAFVRYLLDHGAKVDPRDAYGDTPVDDAFDEDTAIVLLNAGANPARRAQKALENKQVRVLAWLAAHGKA